MILRKEILLFFTLFVSFPLSAQEKVKLWNSTDATRKEQRSFINVFLPEEPDTSGISVIVCPGGSYYWLAMDNEGFSVAKYLSRHGIAAFVLHYRTARHSNHHPAMIEDLQRAIQLVRENAGKYGISPEKVGVMGFSAGGHLAGTASIYFDTKFSDPENKTNVSLRPYFAAMIYPVVSMQDSICHKKSRRNLLGKNYSDDLIHMMSLEKNVCTDMPPVFLLHCTGDKTVDYRNSVVLANALTEKNVNHKFLLLEENGKGGHCFGIKPNGKATGWIDVFREWIYSINNK